MSAQAKFAATTPIPVQLFEMVFKASGGESPRARACPSRAHPAGSRLGVHQEDCACTAVVHLLTDRHCVGKARRDGPPLESGERRGRGAPH